MTEAVRLYGTDVPPAVSERIKVGRLSFTLEEGALRHICVDGTEIIRGIAFLVRDGDWGTLTPKLFEVSRNCDAERFSVLLKAGFDTANATLEVSIFIDAGPAGCKTEKPVLLVSKVPLGSSSVFCRAKSTSLRFTSSGTRFQTCFGLGD